MWIQLTVACLLVCNAYAGQEENETVTVAPWNILSLSSNEILKMLGLHLEEKEATQQDIQQKEHMTDTQEKDSVVEREPEQEEVEQKEPNGNNNVNTQEKDEVVEEVAPGDGVTDQKDIEQKEDNGDVTGDITKDDVDVTPFPEAEVKEQEPVDLEENPDNTNDAANKDNNVVPEAEVTEQEKVEEEDQNGNTNFTPEDDISVTPLLAELKQDKNENTNGVSKKDEDVVPLPDVEVKEQEEIELKGDVLKNDDVQKLEPDAGVLEVIKPKAKESNYLIQTTTVASWVLKDQDNMKQKLTTVS